MFPGDAPAAGVPPKSSYPAGTTGKRGQGPESLLLFIRDVFAIVVAVYRSDVATAAGGAVVVALATRRRTKLVIAGAVVAIDEHGGLRNVRKG
jgi:hypothetical protein